MSEPSQGNTVANGPVDEQGNPAPEVRDPDVILVPPPRPPAEPVSEANATTNLAPTAQAVPEVKPADRPAEEAASQVELTPEEEAAGLTLEAKTDKVRAIAHPSSPYQRIPGVSAAEAAGLEPPTPR
jgi:hypothetical protein